MKSCISAGEQDNIPISIGEGKWYTLKIEKIKQNVQTQTNTGIPLFPYSGWGNFPSHGPQMSKHFNKGHIHHHIVESVQFLNEDTFDDEVDSDDDCDNDCDIEDLHTAEPLRKGLKYFTSGHVQKCKTVLRVDIIF